MASEKDADIICYTFLWNIENISYCWQKQGEIIESPFFVVDAFKLEHFQRTQWNLCLFPRGSGTANYIPCDLCRGFECKGPPFIKIGFELALLATDGSSLVSKRREIYAFGKGESRGFKEFVKREDVFKLKRNEFIPQDTLVIRCRLWRIDKKMSQGVCCIARTRIHAEWRSFHWTIEKFSSHLFWGPTLFKIKLASGETLMNLELHLTDGLCHDERFEIKIISKIRKLKFLKFVSYVLDRKGDKVNSTPMEYFCDGPGTVGTFTLPVSEKKLIQFKDLYLPNGVLSLHCECAFSTGNKSEVIEGVSCSSLLLVKSSLLYNSSSSDLQKVPSDDSGTLKDDLILLYIGDILCDTNLCTETVSIPAHTLVLSARSPVFRAMFMSGMMEKDNECVHITDIDDDTLRRMLMYMYTDVLEDLQWENASQLFSAADKYDIQTLKNKCSSVLKSSLCPANACEILVLADMHQDMDLKRDAVDFILNNDFTVLYSKEWKLLMDTNAKLAAETMYQNWQKG